MIDKTPLRRYNPNIINSEVIVLKRKILFVIRICVLTVSALTSVYFIKNLYINRKNPSDNAENSQQEEEDNEAAEEFCGALTDCVPLDDQSDAYFNVSASDFIVGFDSLYSVNVDKDYLTPTDTPNWSVSEELSPCFGYDTMRYLFRKEPDSGSFPSLSLYTDSECSKIYEIRITFDHHTFIPEYHDLFRTMSIAALRYSASGLTDEKAQEIFETLYAQSDRNIFGNHSFYGDPERPALDTVYRIGNIGYYCFYGSGSIEICVIPLTVTAEDILENIGVPLTKIP